jgi:FkbM family methyltransferase
MPNGLTVFGLNLNDTLNVYNDIFTDDCYRKHGVTISDGDCILDIGANTGLFIVFLNSIGAKVRVYAFEPAPATFQVLQHNVARHNTLPVELFNVGIGKDDGTAAFTYYPRFSNASTFFPDESEEIARVGRQYIIDQIPTLRWPWRPICAALPNFLKHLIAERFRRYYMKKETVTCPVWNLSNFIRQRGIERIDLLKLDAEQSEELILAGIAEEDWVKIRQTVIEVHGGDQATQAIADMLTERGFRAVIDRNPAIPSLALVYAARPALEASLAGATWEVKGKHES